MAWYEWAFSGIGVLLAGSLISLGVHFWKRRKRRSAQPSASVAPVTNSGSLEPSPITADDIESATNGVALLTIEPILAQFKGVVVDWELTLVNAYRHDDQHVGVVGTSDRGVMRVSSIVELDRYPFLRTVKAGNKIRVRGTICSVDGLFIRLEDAAIVWLP